MLALRRFSSVLTPISECSTSWTFCCSCASGASCLGSCAWATGAGAVVSTGDAGAFSALLLASCRVDDALKSGLKLSVLSMGGSEGRAAMVVRGVWPVTGGSSCDGGRWCWPWRSCGVTRTRGCACCLT